ncbi:MAG: hypothetical protein CVU44_20445 [Chloroflexi bacterium HGW-Chloroflexi-6]|nr:MAG: hypothetical protein CVU44_20445 [Chloroflexi bacterium HGW-Chloroflexi-6]
MPKPKKLLFRALQRFIYGSVGILCGLLGIYLLKLDFLKTVKALPFIFLMVVFMAILGLLYDRYVLLIKNED